jgi:hypothetical protein
LAGYQYLNVLDGWLVDFYGLHFVVGMLIPHYQEERWTAGEEK